VFGSFCVAKFPERDALAAAEQRAVGGRALSRVASFRSSGPRLGTAREQSAEIWNAHMQLVPRFLGMTLATALFAAVWASFSGAEPAPDAATHPGIKMAPEPKAELLSPLVSGVCTSLKDEVSCSRLGAAKGCTWSREQVIQKRDGSGTFVHPARCLPAVEEKPHPGPYRALSAFAEAFGMIRANYVEKPDDRKLIEAAIDGMLHVPNLKISSLDKAKMAIPQDADVRRALQVFGDVFQQVRKDHAKEPDEKKLIGAAIDAMLKSLDAHSVFIEAQKLQPPAPQSPSSAASVGLELRLQDGQIRVVRPLDNSPAEQAGIACGDVIVAVDGAPVAGLSLEQVVEKLRGPLNSQVVLSVLGKGGSRPSEITIARRPVFERNVIFIVVKDVGYVLIRNFKDQTASAGLKRAIGEIQKSIQPEELKGYIVDLRDNKGGLLDEAIAVADAFLERGEIVTTRGRNPEDNTRRNARPGDITDGKPIVVLINAGAASGAEIVAGALQDHRRATVIGTRSYGFASIQSLIPLKSGGALKLTTARLYTPAGHDIEGKGIEPDFVVEGPSASDHCAGAVPRDISADLQIQHALRFLRSSQN
jgi:carboxyl-terminal processing protease